MDISIKSFDEFCLSIEMASISNNELGTFYKIGYHLNTEVD